MKTTRTILNELNLIYSEKLSKEKKYEIVEYIKKYALEYHENELNKLRVNDVNREICDCGNFEIEAYSPCCSLSCWQDKFN
jgi:hypothetical protein